MKLEQLIAKHKPEPGTENLAASSGMLWHLNGHGLIEKAVDRQRFENAQANQDPAAADPPVVISRQVAWEVLAEAQRAGVRLSVHRPPPGMNTRGGKS